MTEPTTVVTFEKTLGHPLGHDASIARFKITRVHQTNPRITVYQTGRYVGELTLDAEAAQELIRALQYVMGQQDD